jgi:TPR repeat protein
MEKKNIYLVLILVVFFISTIIDVKIETGDFKYYQSGFGIALAIFIGFLVFAWCIEHAKYYEIELPKGSALLAGLLAPIGVPVYLFRGFGLKEGFFKTAKSVGFLVIISIDVIFALWVADDPIFNTLNIDIQHTETREGFVDFDKENYKVAFDELQDLAILDYVDAQARVAWMYENGKGVEKDHKKAIYWYTKSAEQGDAFSQNILGLFYKDGEAVERDYQEALRWFEKSAGQEYPYAQVNLADMYILGKGVDINYEKAIYLLIKADENGSVEAKELLEMLTPKKSEVE